MTTYGLLFKKGIIMIRYIIFLVVAAIVFSSCTPVQRTIKREEPFEITFEKSNPVLIEKSILGLNISDFLRNRIQVGDLIALRSIEEYQSNKNKTNGESSKDHLDLGTKTLIEDNIISVLVRGGFRVVERDPDAIQHLIEDEANTYLFVYWGSYFPLISVQADSSTIHSANKSHIKTNLYSADKLLTYRVLECGIRYKNPEYSTAYVERIAYTRLHCRLTNAKTGEILHAGIIENEVKDLVPFRVIEELKQIRFELFDFSRPNIQGMQIQKPAEKNYRPLYNLPTTSLIPLEKVEKEEISRSPISIILGIVVLVGLSVLLL